MNNSNIERVISLAAGDTKKGVPVVAKVFYRVLRRRGFSDNQIINIATNIINCLIKSIKVDEKTMEHKGERQKEPQKAYMFQQKNVKTFTKCAKKYKNHKSIHYTA